MEARLVISIVSEKYGHASSLGIRASLFIFITTPPHHFSLSYYALLFVTRLSARVRYALRWRSVGRVGKHDDLWKMSSNDPG